MKNDIFNYTICNLRFAFCNKIKTIFALGLSKYAFFLFLTFNFITLQTFNLGAQGLTKYGQSTSLGTEFVSKNGQIVSSPALSEYGEFLCPASITINHLASGGVAPVDKSVTYGIVLTSLSGASKCWITQNLGSTNQATSATDATELSAGWYWQFNLKQGYKHDGSTLTPAWTITSINENSDWLAANDPCTIELGTGWRIPTTTEWTNADANGQTGGWDNYTETFADVLKLHAVGYLDDGVSPGSLYNRGAIGYYWSSTQGDVTNGWSLYFDSSNSYMYSRHKTYGFSLRCLRD